MDHVKTALVTGAAGFIGSALTQALIKKNYRLYTLDKHPLRSSFITHFQLPISRFSFSTLRVSHPIPDVVFHLAWHGSPAKPASDEEVVAINVEPTFHFFKQAVSAGVKHLVFISSAGSVYGDTGKPAKETDTPQPKSAYGRGKLAVEEYLSSLPVKSTVFRATNVIGTHQQYKNYQGLIPLIIHSVKAGHPLTIYGNSQKDYIDINDVVSAFTSLDKQTKKDEIFNLGSGTNLSLKEIIQLVEATLNQKVAFMKKPAQAYDPQTVHVDISHLTNTLNWKPTRDIRQTIQSLVSSYVTI